MGLLPIIQGDAQRIPLASESVQCVVTSPPYFGLRKYGLENELGHEPTPEMFVEHLVGIFHEVRRVLRSDGCLFVVIGDSYAGSGKGWTREKPRKDGDKQNTNVGSITAGAPVEWGRVGLKDKDLIGVPWAFAFAMRDDGWWLRRDNIWLKRNKMCESAKDRATTKHEYIFHFSKSERQFYNKERDLTSVWDIPNRSYGKGHHATFAPEVARRCIAAGSSPAACGVCGAPWAPSREKTGATHRREPAHVPNNTPTKVDSSGWEPAWRLSGELEPTCSHNDPSGRCVVLDPFCGSGTTVEVAYELRRVGIGLDLVWDYCRNHAVKRYRKGQAKGRQEVLAL